MISKKQQEKLYQLKEKIEKETGIKTVIDPKKGTLAGFRVKEGEIERVKEIIANFYGQETKVDTEIYTLKQWESKHKTENAKEQKEVGDKEQYELDYEPDFEPDFD